MRSGQLDEAALRQKYIINHNRSDNRLENLQLMTHKEHAALHIRERNKKEEE